MYRTYKQSFRTARLLIPSFKINYATEWNGHWVRCHHTCDLETYMPLDKIRSRVSICIHYDKRVEDV